MHNRDFSLDNTNEKDNRSTSKLIIRNGPSRIRFNRTPATSSSVISFNGPDVIIFYVTLVHYVLVYSERKCWGVTYIFLCREILIHTKLYNNVRDHPFHNVNWNHRRDPGWIYFSTPLTLSHRRLLFIYLKLSKTKISHGYLNSDRLNTVSIYL